jgi:hypothetical protein
LIDNIKHCSCYNTLQSKSPSLEQQTIQVGAGVLPPPSAERVLDSHRLQTLEIQVKVLQDEVARISELSLKTSSAVQKTASAQKTVADDTVLLSKAVNDLAEIVNKLAHTVKKLSRGRTFQVDA